ncbi:MAG: trehalase family glycosidase [Patescibacteria group bacterium]|nr:trehalase family glycosidase [Patescibacteria group bacterium]
MIDWLNIFKQKDGGDRGQYFPIKTYAQNNQSLPSFEEAKNLLPAPIIEKNPDFIKMYWKSWELTFAHLRKVKPNSQFVSDYLDEAFSDNIFQWDTIFMLMFARYGQKTFPFIRSLDNFYARQHKSGYICREISEINGNDFVFLGRKYTINPPLFSFIEMENFKLTGNIKRLKIVLPSLEKYAKWLEQPGNLENSNSRYWEKYGRWSKESKHNLYWNTNLGSGMDNLIREGNGHVDMSSQMVIMYKNLALICQKLGLFDKEKIYQNKADEISNRINQWCWNENDGFYYDINHNGEQIKYKTINAFWTLLAGVPNKNQAQKLVQHLKNSKTFWRLFVFPALAADQKNYSKNGDYWQGGVWAPTNYMVIKGLENYNYFDLAYKTSRKYLQGLSKVFEKTNTLWENYAPENFAPGQPAKKNFVGWTGLGPIALLIENILGFKYDYITNTLTWHIKRKDYHGLKNMYFNQLNISAIFEPTNPASIKILTNKKFKLIVYYNHQKKKYLINQKNKKIILK